jgi:PAS domain S-box-containing protein
MNTPLRILMAEDSEDDYMLVLRELKRAGYIITSKRIETPEALIHSLDTESWDIILSDYSMPRFSAIEALKIVQSIDPIIPFIIVSGTVGEDTAVAAMKAGAHDFFSKDKLTRLIPAVERELREAQQRRQHRQAAEELRNAEERFAKTFQASPIGITITGADGTFMDVNRAATEILGYSRKEMLGKSTTNLDLWFNHGPNTEITEQLQRFGKARNIEEVIRDKAGHIRDVLASFETIRIGDEDCVLSLFQDITERKQVERQLIYNTNLIVLLQEVTVAANEATEINKILQFTIDHICTFTGWTLGHVYMRARGENPQLVSAPIWHYTDPEPFKRFIYASDALRSSKESGDLIYRITSSQQVICLEDLNTADYFIRAQQAEEAGLISVCGFPVIAQQEVVAVMEFYSNDVIEHDEALLNTIQNICTQIGQAIGRIRANEELHALYTAISHLFKADTLRDMSNQIVNSVAAEFEYVSCGLFFINEQTSEPVLTAHTPSYVPITDLKVSLHPASPLTRSFEENSVVHYNYSADNPPPFPNNTKIKSQLIVPLKIQSGLIGLLDLQSERADNFDKRDKRILSAFAERAAAALEIRQLYEELNQHTNQLEQRVIERTEELQQEKNRVEAILQDSSDVILLLNPSGEIQQFNPAFHKLFSPPNTGANTLSIINLFAPQHQTLLQNTLQQVISNNAPCRIELVAIRKDGTHIDVDLALSPIQGHQYNKDEIVCNLRDITAQKNIEAELRNALEKEQELRELKNRFISMASHEFRTPLTIIMSSVYILSKALNRLDDNARESHFNKIRSQVNQMTILLDDVLSIGKMESKHVDFAPKLMDIKQFCYELIQEFHDTFDGDYTLEYSTTQPGLIMPADEKLLRQAFGNLISNAAKYSPQGSTIHVALAHNADELTFTVADQGIGIPEEDKEHLFEVFHRASNVGQLSGTGLGLAIAKQAVELHGGTIDFVSHKGEGTTFTIVLPLSNLPTMP